MAHQSDRSGVYVGAISISYCRWTHATLSLRQRWLAHLFDTEIEFTDAPWDGCQYWQELDPKLGEKINAQIDAYMDSPTSGIGKPEPLKGT
nr:type II toxin-antitoxin system YoeB family toxin [Duganella sp. CF458]